MGRWRGADTRRDGGALSAASLAFVILRQGASAPRPGDPAAPEAICSGRLSWAEALPTGSRSRAPLGPPVSLRSPEDDESGNCCAASSCSAIKLSRPNRLFFLHIVSASASRTRRRKNPPYNPAHPVEGEGVGSTFLDDGGLWSSDEARAEESPGVLVGRRWMASACSPRAFGWNRYCRDCQHVPPSGPSATEVRDAGEAREGPPAGGASG